MTALPFDVASLVAGVAAGLGVGTLLARRWLRAERRPPDALWQALQKEPPVAGDATACWQEALAQTQRLHEAALRSHHLHLRTLAAEQRLQHTELVLAHLQDGLLVVDGDERVLYGNHTARAVLQLGDRDPVTLAEAAAPFAVVDAVRSVLAADLGRTVKTSRIEVDHGGERHVYLIRAVAESETSGTRAQVVVLEDWTAEERQARSKSDFIYSVSHELKTPLTAIQASLELANDDDDLDPSDRDKLIQVSYDESVRLSTMVQELLDLARIEAGITEFKRETIDMRELFQSLHALHQPVAEKRQIALKWDISDYLADLFGDARLLRQALVNVVGNGLKYTKAGGEVALTARLEGHELVVRVRDTGIGIAAEDQGRVFEKFYRAKSAEQSAITGTGLGLPMARYIVERHRGRIEFTSELGVGTEFRVYLPVQSVDPDEAGGSTLLAVDGAEQRR